MTRKIISSVMVTGTAFALIGCGGGSSDTQIDTAGTNTVETGTGNYLDSAVSGISYVCGSQEGTTDEDGTFTFDEGAICTFTLAGVELRTVDATTLEDGVQIIEQNPRVAQLLQSLDLNGDPSDGITITPEVVAAIEAAGFDGIPTDDTEVQALVAAAAEAVETFDGQFTTVEAAVEHVNETVAQVSAAEAVFNLPAKYYEVEEEHYDNVLRYEAGVLTMTETAFTHEEYEFEGGAFIPEAQSSQGEHTDYILQDGSWVVETMDTTSVALSADKKVYTIDGKHQLTFQSIRDVEGAVEFIEDSQISVTLPAGAERITFKYTALADTYGVDNPHWAGGSLEDVISSQCGDRYFDHVEKEGLDMEGISFNCDDIGKTSGTLVGVNFNDDYSSSELIPNVGTWQITTLPGSNIRAIVTDIKPEYMDDENALFAMKDGVVWRGWHTKAGSSDDFTVYNEVAFKAFEVKLKALIPTEFTQEVVSANPWYIVEYGVEDGNNAVYCNGVFTMDGNNNITVSWNDPGDSGTATGTYSIVDGKFITSHDGKTETETLLSVENGTIITDKLAERETFPATYGNKKWYKNQVDAEAYLSANGVSSCF